jgi:hypothetical protein
MSEKELLALMTAIMVGAQQSGSDWHWKADECESLVTEAVKLAKMIRAAVEPSRSPDGAPAAKGEATSKTTTAIVAATNGLNGPTDGAIGNTLYVSSGGAAWNAVGGCVDPVDEYMLQTWGKTKEEMANGC